MSQRERRSFEGIPVVGECQTFAYISGTPVVDNKGKHLTCQEYLIGLALRNLHSYDVRLTARRAHWIFSGMDLNNPLEMLAQQVTQRTAEIVEATPTKATNKAYP